MRTLFITLATLFSAVAFGGTVTGTYKAENPKAATLFILGKDKVVHPDKKGRFAIKNVDLEEDILIIQPANRQADTFQVALFGHSLLEIEEQTNMLDVQLIPRPIVPSAEYGGIIIMQNELLQTGKLNTLEAIKVKYPQSPTATFNGSMEPLYFLDGVETTDISFVTIQETAYAEVVRPSNPGCTAFGSRGGNGLILLTTQTRFAVQHPEKDRLKPRRLNFLLSK